MSDDFLDKIENTWRNWTGDPEWTPEKCRQNFLMYGGAKRAQALDQLDDEMGRAEPTMENLRRYTDLAELRQTLDDDHRTLLKKGM